MDDAPNQARALPLFDPDAQPQSWNERMVPGEFAVLYSHLGTGSEATCTIFTSRAEAEAHAALRVTGDPTLRCSVYDHHGFGMQPLAEFSGSQYKGGSEISSRLRRWLGSFLLAGGMVLGIVEWQSDFALSWAGMIGARIAPVGLILVLTELVIVIDRRRRAKTNAV